MRPRLDYGDIIYDEAYNKIFHQKLESIQYNTYLAVWRAIIASSREKLYQQLGLESLQWRRWYKSLCLFYRDFKENKVIYFFSVVPAKSSNYNTRNADKTTLFPTKDNFFKKNFFHPLLLNGTN